MPRLGKPPASFVVSAASCAQVAVARLEHAETTRVPADMMKTADALRETIYYAHAAMDYIERYCIGTTTLQTTETERVRMTIVPDEA